MRDFEGSVADLSRLFAEDGAQQALLGGQIGLALRRDLADQNITAAHLCADADDAAVVEILERIVADAGISRVISSGPSFVSRASHSNSSI